MALFWVHVIHRNNGIVHTVTIDHEGTLFADEPLSENAWQAVVRTAHPSWGIADHTGGELHRG